jgi:hypothetical protein
MKTYTTLSAGIRPTREFKKKGLAGFSVRASHETHFNVSFNRSAPWGADFVCNEPALGTKLLQQHESYSALFDGIARAENC